MSIFSESELAHIKIVLEEVLQSQPDLALVDCVDRRICAFDITELRDLFEEKLGFDIDTVTVRQVLVNWAEVLEPSR